MLTAAEQLFLEQVNRARLDPLAEAARFGIDLNAGLAAGTLNGSFSRQPLAANDALTRAARGHSADYQTGGVVGGHTGSDDSSPSIRAVREGYGSSFVGENLAFMAATNPGSTGLAFTAGQAMTVGTGLQNSQSHHEGLFRSPGHRENMLFGTYTEAGIGQDLRQGVNPGWAEGADVGSYPWTSSVVTSKFGRETMGDRFLTGVIYNDTDSDQFYSIGEGLAGVGISLGAGASTSATAGGYKLKLTAGQTGLTGVSFTVNGQSLDAQVGLGAGNVKLDLVGAARLMASSDLVLGAGIREGGLLGLGNWSLTGNALDNLLIVGRGNNTINGGAGTDTALFTGAMADYQINITAGIATVTDLRTTVAAQGTNTLSNVERLQFSDQVHLLTPPNTGGGITLSGQLGRLGGDGLVGAEVTFTPAGGGQQMVLSGSDGRFHLDLGMGGAGHLNASRAHSLGDPTITANDALDVLRLAVGVAPSFGGAQAAHFIAADINRDGMVTAADALDVLRAAVGLPSSHVPRWIFVGADMLDGLSLNAANASVQTGLDLNATSSASGLELMGILLGNLEPLNGTALG